MVENSDYEALKKDFRKETSKLDNWLNHHRIDEYFKEPKKECDGCNILDPDEECLFGNTGANCKHQDPPYKGPE